MAEIINIGKKLRAVNLKSAVCFYGKNSSGMWETDCEISWDFTDKPHEYNFNFCPNCGKVVVFEEDE